MSVRFSEKRNPTVGWNADEDQIDISFVSLLLFKQAHKLLGLITEENLKRVLLSNNNYRNVFPRILILEFVTYKKKVLSSRGR